MASTCQNTAAATWKLSGFNKAGYIVDIGIKIWTTRKIYFRELTTFWLGSVVTHLRGCYPLSLHPLCDAFQFYEIDFYNNCSISDHLTETVEFFAFNTKVTKYQGVKEFHMLARIDCYCKIMVFSPFKAKDTYYHSSKKNNYGGPSNLCRPLKFPTKWAQHLSTCLKLQSPYYHPLNQWLLGATNGNERQAVMHLQSSEIINHP